jgi:dTDP-4-dehydrorhamnose 3,5-epimerase
MSKLTKIELPLQDLMLVERNHLSDERGFFVRLFCANELGIAGWTKPIQQINFTHTKHKGSVRGMHFQNNPFAEMKMVTCLQGSVFDVAVDLRPESETFLHWHGEILSLANKRSLIIPEGFAHGFQALDDDCELLYFHSEPYDQPSEEGILFDDQKIGISWPIEITEVSKRDKSHHPLDSNFRGVICK